MKLVTLIFAAAILTFFHPASLSIEPMQDKQMSTGSELYTRNCLACHQADGNGVKNMFPPLAGNKVITGPSDTLIKIVLNGMEGPIQVNGVEYDQLMPAQDYLSDSQIADILSYIRSSWGNKAGQVKPGEVAKLRKEKLNKIH